MDLDWQTCSQARLSRDARFDGKFFIGVRTTKIYCRSVCPVPTVKEENVRYYPTAAAAAEAGLRPCLRCRPECAPGTPAWLGTSSTVSRALRLIGESGLEDSGLEGLADRLGVSSRHLRRLFIQHLGAPPSAIVKTRRLHFAKRLIDETGLSMTDIAFASGFGCVRRFNAVIRETYKRTPTEIRNRHKSLPQSDDLHFLLKYRPPYNWSAILSFLAAHAIPGVESIKDERYRRSISINGHHGYFEVSLNEEHDALAVRVRFPDPHSLYQIIERIRRMFDLNADWATIGQTLSADPELASRIAAEPGLRIPGCWDSFELTVWAILAQQAGEGEATRLAGQIAESFGKPILGVEGLRYVFPSPEILSKTAMNLPERCECSVRAFAQAVYAGRISFERVVDTDKFLATLRETALVGQATVQYIAMRALGEPDILSSGGLNQSPSREIETRAEKWRPWRAYASMYLMDDRVSKLSAKTC